jgi:hypothetical protein
VSKRPDPERLFSVFFVPDQTRRKFQSGFNSDPPHVGKVPTYLKKESLLGLVIQIPFKVGQLLPHLLAGFFFLLGRFHQN